MRTRRRGYLVVATLVAATAAILPSVPAQAADDSEATRAFNDAVYASGLPDRGELTTTTLVTDGQGSYPLHVDLAFDVDTWRLAISPIDVRADMPSRSGSVGYAGFDGTWRYRSADGLLDAEQRTAVSWRYGSAVPVLRQLGADGALRSVADRVDFMAPWSWAAGLAGLRADDELQVTAVPDPDLTHLHLVSSVVGDEGTFDFWIDDQGRFVRAERDRGAGLETSVFTPPGPDFRLPALPTEVAQLTWADVASAVSAYRAHLAAEDSARRARLRAAAHRVAVHRAHRLARAVRTFARRHGHAVSAASVRSRAAILARRGRLAGVEVAAIGAGVRLIRDCGDAGHATVRVTVHRHRVRVTG